jgi:hypothetical protein
VYHSKSMWQKLCAECAQPSCLGTPLTSWGLFRQVCMQAYHIQHGKVSSFNAQCQCRQIRQQLVPRVSAFQQEGRTCVCKSCEFEAHCVCYERSAGLELSNLPNQATTCSIPICRAASSVHSLTHLPIGWYRVVMPCYAVPLHVTHPVAL